MTAVAKLPEISTFIEQMDMLRDDFVKYQDGNKSVPFVVLRDALVAALNAYDDARAALSPAELGGVELDEAERRSRDQRAMGWDAVCDELFELRPGWVHGEGTGIECAVAVIRDALSTPRAAEAVTVDKAMIERAVNACIQSKGRYSAYHAPETDDEWRAALTVALTPPSAKGE